jgi:hypothetical protein
VSVLSFELGHRVKIEPGQGGGGHADPRHSSYVARAWTARRRAQSGSWRYRPGRRRRRWRRRCEGRGGERPPGSARLGDRRPQRTHGKSTAWRSDTLRMACRSSSGSVSRTRTQSGRRRESLFGRKHADFAGWARTPLKEAATKDIVRGVVDVHARRRCVCPRPGDDARTR